MKTAEERLEAMRVRALSKPCGFRGKYVAGCRCAECRRANREYAARRNRERMRTGDVGEFVEAAPVQRYLLHLSAKGIGYRQVADAAKVGKTIVRRILDGESPRCRATTAQRLLDVDGGAIADHALVKATGTWRLLNELIADGYTRAWLAQQLGCVTPALQIGKYKVLAVTAMRVKRLYDDLMAGRIRRVA